MIKTNSEQFARPIPHNKNTVSIPLEDKQKKQLKQACLMSHGPLWNNLIEKIFIIHCHICHMLSELQVP